MTGQRTAGKGSSPDGGTWPYVAVIVVALVVGAGLALYVAGYRAEIMSILTQSPT